MKVDGKYGKGTVAAVKAFQRKNGLHADGIAGPKTLGKLYGSTGNEAADASAQADSAAAASASSGKSATGSLKQGSSGDGVKDLQTKLWYTGYYTGSISGSFDAATHTAVTAFQKAKGLTRDGIAGKKTLTALDTETLCAVLSALDEEQLTAVIEGLSDEKRQEIRDILKKYEDSLK